MATSSDGVMMDGRLRDAIQNRTATSDLIQQEGQIIILNRPTSLVSDGAGGQTRPDEDSTAQTPIRRFFSLDASEPLQTGQVLIGESYHDKFVLIGLWDDDIQVDDFFILGGKTFTVRFIHPDRIFQTKAEGECTNDGRV